MSSVKNYTEQGGERTVIGGTLEIAAGGQVVGLFTPAAFQADSTVTTSGTGDGLQFASGQAKSRGPHGTNQWLSR